MSSLCLDWTGTAISGSKELFPRSRYSPVWSEISSSNIRAFWNQNKVSWASWVERRTFNCNRNSKNARKFELCISDQTGEFLLCGKSYFDPDMPVRTSTFSKYLLWEIFAFARFNRHSQLFTILITLSNANVSHLLDSTIQGCHSIKNQERNNKICTIILH